MSRDEQADYYDAGGIETIDIVAAKQPLREHIGYLHGTAMVYLSRLFWKGKALEEIARDARKCHIYVGWLADTLEQLAEGRPEAEYLGLIAVRPESGITEVIDCADVVAHHLEVSMELKEEQSFPVEEAGSGRKIDLPEDAGRLKRLLYWIFYRVGGFVMRGRNGR